MNAQLLMLLHHCRYQTMPVGEAVCEDLEEGLRDLLCPSLDTATDVLQAGGLSEGGRHHQRQHRLQETIMSVATFTSSPALQSNRRKTQFSHMLAEEYAVDVIQHMHDRETYSIESSAFLTTVPARYPRSSTEGISQPVRMGLRMPDDRVQARTATALDRCRKLNGRMDWWDEVMALYSGYEASGVEAATSDMMDFFVLSTVR
ncbi:hypothetical protein BC939DRAFT_493795 [Gamsiella multidivaricata]|uniref:uncharacterized protein n=1 Tax=Gamsiella multidivaricata TaxID=101098 RepID=UPI00221F2FE7|nr:uncharacterized protein BC939DRAFT_493795 [Gamsiella multidivaricata]KAI7822025.1 hypothetical protein BC939DRAFT_493795 [Gamsiella multidivaricata]